MTLGAGPPAVAAAVGMRRQLRATLRDIETLLAQPVLSAAAVAQHRQDAEELSDQWEGLALGLDPRSPVAVTAVLADTLTLLTNLRAR